MLAQTHKHEKFFFARSSIINKATRKEHNRNRIIVYKENTQKWAINEGTCPTSTAWSNLFSGRKLQ